MKIFKMDMSHFVTKPFIMHHLGFIFVTKLLISIRIMRILAVNVGKIGKKEVLIHRLW